VAQILDGKALAAGAKQELAARCQRLIEAIGHVPRMAIITLEDDGASGVYVRTVARTAAAVGIEPLVIALHSDATAETVAEAIEAQNADPQVAGIVVAQPLPVELPKREILDRIDPARDIDGATTISAGRLARGEATFAPATAEGVMRLLEANGIPVAGRRAVVVGRSPVIGRPVAALLLAADATVTVSHRKTADLAEITRQAEILVVAAGVPHLIGSGAIAAGAVIVDVGITPGPGGLQGDVDFAAVEPIAGAISPVPGGVGPVTSVILAEHTLEAAASRAGISV
jgi:methylenetetrahydrofolate dehydrogenase (NADP+) / methenyltetrahydrofolate cyclohydrolase